MVYTVKQVTELVGVSNTTLKRYEKNGLIPPVMYSILLEEHVKSCVIYCLQQGDLEVIQQELSETMKKMMK